MFSPRDQQKQYVFIQFYELDMVSIGFHWFRAWFGDALRICLGCVEDVHMFGDVLGICLNVFEI